MRVLTGITTSGTPHLGNYAGAIRPAIAASRQAGVDAFFFLADYHALIKCEDPQRIARSRLEIAATWIAAGLDVERATFYRQSDVPEIAELCWMLTCVTPKGLMNRAHAYKAAVDQNMDRDVDPDDGVTMGLFSYPVLMAADILMFNAEQVPVGRDQIQHIEMARDIAQRFNHLYGAGRELFVLPEARIDEQVATLPGLDGRKMSKSYGNTIPLFEGGTDALRAAIMRIVTDSRLPGEPKDPDSTSLPLLYGAFATPQEQAAFCHELKQGLAWSAAKLRLFERIEAELAPMRRTYAELMADPDHIESLLLQGAEKARRISAPFLSRLREAVGLKQPAAVKPPKTGKARAARRPRFVSFRDPDGSFRFRLLGAQGEQLLLSEPLTTPAAVGLAIEGLQGAPLQELATEADGVTELRIDGLLVCRLAAEDLVPAQEALSALGTD